jgi:regulator of nonsense transcripts 1
VKAKHKDISLHPESSHGETVLECYICLNRNIFLLGFVPLQSTDIKQVIIVCRTPCLAMKSFGEVVWDSSDWTALVEEKMIVNWLVAVPT